MRRGCLDFISGKPADIMTFFNAKIDIHHVFPRAWCLKRGMKPPVFNSIVNKTPLSKLSNISIGGDAPSIYLKRIEQKQGLSSHSLDNILRSHLIEPQHLRSDDFDAFFTARIKALANLVGEAMAKPVVIDQGKNEEEYDTSDQDADETEDELADAG
jgi:hypothetical protein